MIMDNNKKQLPTITVGELRSHLKVYSDDYEISFSGLEFLQVKSRGAKLIQIEFSQSVYQDEQGDVVVQNH